MHIFMTVPLPTFSFPGAETRIAIAAFLQPDKVTQKFQTVYFLLYNKYYVDELYDTVIVNPVKRLSHYCFSFDLSIIDGFVNGAAWFTRMTAWLSHKFDIYFVDGIINSMATAVDFNSGIWRRIQTGYLQNYAFIFVIGLLVIVGGMLLLA